MPDNLLVHGNVKETLDLRRVQVHSLMLAFILAEDLFKLTMTWSHPASRSMLATSFAVMGALDLSFLSWRA